MRALYTRITCAKVGPHLFTSAQRAEVLACFWCYLVPELKDDAALILDQLTHRHTSEMCVQFMHNQHEYTSIIHLATDRDVKEAPLDHSACVLSNTRHNTKQTRRILEENEQAGG
jgi:hypothetical protein